MKKMASLCLILVLTLQAAAQSSEHTASNERTTNFTKTRDTHKGQTKRKTVWEKILRRSSALIVNGIGYDSNPFAAPSEPYTDYATTAENNITPTILAGLYTPIALTLSYRQYLMHHLYLNLGAEYDGRLFFDPKLANANEQTLKGNLGAEYFFERLKKRKKSVAFVLFGMDHNETYFDHDNGDDKLSSGGTNIANRYQYKSTGARLRYREKYKKLQWSARYRYEVLDYVTPASWSELDHTYHSLRLKGSYRFNRRVSLKGGYHFYSRAYTFRKAYDYVDTAGRYKLITGTQLHYLTNEASVEGAFRPLKRVTTAVRYGYSHRDDTYAGYGTSDMNRIKAQLSYKKGRIGLSGAYEWQYRSYPIAVAYDRLKSQPAKYALINRLKGAIRYRFTEAIEGGVRIDYRDQKSSDLRYQFNDFSSLIYLKATL